MEAENPHQSYLNIFSFDAKIYTIIDITIHIVLNMKANTSFPAASFHLSSKTYGVESWNNLIQQLRKWNKTAFKNLIPLPCKTSNLKTFSLHHLFYAEDRFQLLKTNALLIYYLWNLMHNTKKWLSEDNTADWELAGLLCVPSDSVETHCPFPLSIKWKCFYYNLHHQNEVLIKYCFLTKSQVSRTELKNYSWYPSSSLKDTV